MTSRPTSQTANPNPAQPSIAAVLGGLLLDVLLPSHCLACRRHERGTLALGLCAACRSRLRPLMSPTVCELCAEALPNTSGHRSLCLACCRRKSPIDRLYAGWSFEPPLDSVIHRLKFTNLPYLGKHLGAELAELLPAELEADLKVDAIVPVPLHWRRKWQRGYNQSLEIAQTLSERRHWPLASLLVRRRPTVPQTGLERAARRRNLRSAFRVRNGWLAKSTRASIGLHLLLIDDVYTTGATLEAAAGALKASGVGRISAVVAGRTPIPLP